MVVYVESKVCEDPVLRQHCRYKDVRCSVCTFKEGKCHFCVFICTYLYFILCPPIYPVISKIVFLNLKKCISVYSKTKSAEFFSAGVGYRKGLSPD